MLAYFVCLQLHLPAFLWLPSQVPFHHVSSSRIDAFRLLRIVKDPPRVFLGACRFKPDGVCDSHSPKVNRHRRPITEMQSAGGLLLSDSDWCCLACRCFTCDTRVRVDILQIPDLLVYCFFSVLFLRAQGRDWCIASHLWLIDFFN